MKSMKQKGTMNVKIIDVSAVLPAFSALAICSSL
jgi:hypothetical protein